MARSKDSKTRVDLSATPGFGGSLGDLLRAQGAVPAAPAAPAPSADPEAAPHPPAAPDVITFDPRFAGPLRLRVDRKQRHGKTVVCIEGLFPDPPGTKPPKGKAPPKPPDPRGVPDEAIVAALLRDLKQGLGTGAQREGQLIVVQGDQLPRVRTLLSGRGYRVS
jgi:translation initiation factor 1 (eIF-1/SUI1)